MSKRTRKGERTLAILGYHKIGPAPDEWDTWFYIPRETFISHLKYLKKHRWKVIDLATALAGLYNLELLPARSILLTFDDGYRSIRQYGLPELVEFGFPSVMFVPTDYIGGRNDFDRDNEPEEAICAWDDLRALERHGMSVQSHGAAHPAFSDLDAVAQDDELRRSRAVLEAGLGKRAEVFSFPYGDAGPDASAMRQALRSAGYRAACLYGGGPVRLPGADPFRLDRIAMGPDTDIEAELVGCGTTYEEG